MTRTLETVPTYSDYFCGFGGSSQGARKLGLNIRMAANHWDLAVETHALNFPDSDHDQADISGTDPRRHPTTTIAWFSPECTNHSMAKGKKRQAKATQMAFGEEQPPLPDAAADRSRATMWDVPRFAEYHRYRYVIVENVVDARYWIMWDAWLQAMAAMEYEHHVVYLNSMHAGSDVTAPAPQSRDRMYVVFWQRGERAPDLRITPPAWCGHCDRQVEAQQSWKKPLHRWGRYRAQYVYRCPACLSVVEPYTLPAAAAIDWSTPGQRIGEEGGELQRREERPALRLLVDHGRLGVLGRVLRQEVVLDGCLVEQADDEVPPAHGALGPALPLVVPHVQLDVRPLRFERREVVLHAPGQEALQVGAVAAERVALVAGEEAGDGQFEGVTRREGAAEQLDAGLGLCSGTSLSGHGSTPDRGGRCRPSPGGRTPGGGRPRSGGLTTVDPVLGTDALNARCSSTLAGQSVASTPLTGVAA